MNVPPADFVMIAAEPTWRPAELARNLLNRMGIPTWFHARSASERPSLYVPDQLRGPASLLIRRAIPEMKLTEGSGRACQ